LATTTLVDQFKSAADREQRDKARTARRRRLRRIIVGTAILAVVVMAAIIAKFAYDRHRAALAVDEAGQQLRILTPAALDEADRAVERSLAAWPDNPDARGLEALIAAHRAFVQGDAAPSPDDALARAEDAGAPSYHLAIAGTLRDLAAGDVEAANATLTSLPPAPEDSPVAHHGDWLTGVVALAEAHDQKRIAHALPTVTSAVDAAPDWVVYLRTQNALRFAASDAESMQAELATARASHPEDLGLAVDETYFHALLHQTPGAVVLTAEKLLAPDATLFDFDVARVHLARGLARMHQGQRDPAIEDLVSAWSEAARWDGETRHRALTALRWLGAIERARELVARLPEGRQRALYEASLYVAAADPVPALEILATLPQDDHEVAYLLALALVEQRRFEEASLWVIRARKFFPDRQDLQVAEQRVAAATGDSSKAVATLGDIGDAHPETPRVWTALGEAHRAADDTQAALAAYRKAIEREAHPAEAHLALARSIEGNVHEDAEIRDALTKHLRDAAEAAPALPSYRYAFADHLLQIGQEPEAERRLRELVEVPGVEPVALLRLSEYVVASTPEFDAETDAEVTGWLDRADKLGADPTVLARERARAAVASGDASRIATARDDLAARVAKTPDDAELHLVYVLTLLASGDLDGARTEARYGVRRLKKPGNGRFYRLWAETEAARLKYRSAARIARDAWRQIRDESHLDAHQLLDVARRSIDLYMKEGKDEIARRTGRELTMTLPLDPDAWAMRARLEFDSKMDEAGCETALKGGELEPKTPAIHDAAAQCYRRTGRKAEADAEKARAEALRAASSSRR